MDKQYVPDDRKCCAEVEYIDGRKEILDSTIGILEQMKELGKIKDYVLVDGGDYLNVAGLYHVTE